MLKAMKLDEAGYESALIGLSMAMKHRTVEFDDWWSDDKFLRSEHVARANAGRGKGHDKYLRMIQTWWLLDMTRFLSQEFATYKVGTVTSSASTMHRLCSEPLTLDSFSIDALNEEDIKAMQFLIDRINDAIDKDELLRAKKMLPEGYMLEQVWNCNYAVINCIIAQRSNHKMSGWSELIKCFREQCDHPELLIGYKDNK